MYKLTDTFVSCKVIQHKLIAWIEAFLVGRQQRVKINGTFSNWIDVLSGIPQGTILGPLLFVIYINDLPDVCDHLAKIYLFADDAKLFRHIQTCLLYTSDAADE